MTRRPRLSRSNLSEEPETLRKRVRQAEPDGLHAQIGLAVTREYRTRWSYVRGSSTRRLRPLLGELGEIDLFLHDSKHTERNLRVELDHAWRALRPGGAILADDIDVNRGFRSLTGTFPNHQALVCRREPLEPDLKRQDETGIFGFIRKPDSRERTLESG